MVGVRCLFFLRNGVPPCYFSSEVKDCTFRGHSDSVDQLCWHPKNLDQLVTASGDKTIRIWDARTNRSVATVNTKGENINICWSPDGSIIAVGNKDDLITFIDVRSHRSKDEEQFKFEVNEISWNNDRDLFFLTSGQGSMNILRLEWPVRTLSFSHDGKMLASESDYRHSRGRLRYECYSRLDFDPCMHG
eukprot:XP_019918606.1 PREDICTED: THO complex subunit 3-like [Crassostrea gigas]